MRRIGLSLIVTVLLAPHLAVQKPLPLNTIKVPPGFRIDLFADGVENARSMVLSPGGVLYVGTRTKGSVYAIVDRNADGKAERVHTIATGLRMPNGVAFKDGALYVAEVNKVTKYDGIDAHLEQPPAPVVVNDTFPTERHHGWKFIAFGPDGKLYVPVGAPCNICESSDPRFASITRMNGDGTDVEVFASGVRNTVGFDWHPATKELWFTDNGRDLLGDETPPDELNVAAQPKLHFGYPYCHGEKLADPEFGGKRPCNGFTPPARALGPHVAAIGMRFYTGRMFPQQYRQQIFIAEHGSWNRSRKLGYRVMLVTLEGSKATSYVPFAEGWLQGENDWGRPADVLVMPDGALLVSDDKANAIYRISYRR
jgi:glucose/arabinose dehydrogenase